MYNKLDIMPIAHRRHLVFTNVIICPDSKSPSSKQRYSINSIVIDNDNKY